MVLSSLSLQGARASVHSVVAVVEKVVVAVAVLVVVVVAVVVSETLL